jgi:structural maintenance of chromosome 3 (chondroitin sulfate proteoglycan 6)
VEGDQVNRKGALTGGFIDVRTSRIEAMRNIATIRDKLKKLTAKAEKLKAAIQGTLSSTVKLRTIIVIIKFTS